ncbi:MAG TPA: aldo/keto reductase, partial [Burkholderiales bacterium]|nr:aldo/keto reductase [Burkholderiales bacterium]
MTFKTDLSRRRVLAATAGAAAGAVLAPIARFAHAADESVMTRPIPHSGERLPIIGIGTAIIFDFENDAAKLEERKRVVQTLVAGGGKLIDTAHSYGRAEDRLGEVVADLGVRDRLFLATKFGYRDDRAAATASLQASLKRLKTNRIDLMQA